MIEPPLRLARRPRDAHKGRAGRVLVLAGSRGMVGAAALAAQAALRTGAGLVTVGCPESVYPILAAKVTCPTTWPLPETAEGSLSLDGLERVLERAAAAHAVAMGPGLGRHPQTGRLARAVIEGASSPWVADADALFAIAHDRACLDRAPALGVMTPHPGEMAALLGIGTREVQLRREDAARGLARAHPHVVLLKGAGTLVAQAEALWTNPTGNPGLATGGTGDVLTGVIAALLADGLSPFDAARLGAWLHGRAGDLAAERLGERGLIATDVVDALPSAVREAEG